MNIKDIANKLVNYCRKGDDQKAQEELYSKDVISLEPEGARGGTKKGLDEVKQKKEEWRKSIQEVHNRDVSDPIVSDNYFTCHMSSDVTFKGDDHPTHMDELCVYEVKDGKIVSEQFFYKPKRI